MTLPVFWPLKTIFNNSKAIIILFALAITTNCLAGNPYTKQSTKQLVKSHRHAKPLGKKTLYRFPVRFKHKKPVIRTEDFKKNWEKKRSIKMKKAMRNALKKSKRGAAKLRNMKARGKLKMPFPAPPKNRIKKNSPWSSLISETVIATLAHAFLPEAVQANTGTHYQNIIIDGDLSDWSINDRINLPLDRPPYLATGDEFYGKYVTTPEPTYIIALKSTGPALGPNTTFWLNTDQDSATGHLVWGLYGGAEYFVNIYTDSTPHLYSSNFEWVTGALDHAYSTDQKILEIAIPASALGSISTSQSIDLLGDINDSVFLFPQDYADGGQFTLQGSTPALPPRTDFSKRVGIIYSETTKNNFFNDKSYSQLFMALQHQAMMAGITFELLEENNLLDINNLVNFDALIFPFFADIQSTNRKQIHDNLYQAIYHYGIGIITAGDWITNDEAGNSLSADAYMNMKQLLGITRVNGEGPVNIDLSAQAISHPAMKGYSSNELIISYENGWYSYFQGVPGQPVDSLAIQTVTGNFAGSYPAVLASTTGGRNVHFATLGYMADTNLVWQALQWVVYGNQTPVGLKISRANNVFVSRNDMDQSKLYDEVPNVHIPLLNLLQNWKQNYNFVGSYFINIGNDPAAGQWTDWGVSGPLFRDYIALDNEIGTHSWTHPLFTDQLTASDIEFEFNQSINEIDINLNPTWRNQSIRGGAVPGAPENLNTATQIIQHLDYLSGGYSGFGAGYPSAIGYLTPVSNKVYFSPNMTFDFTLIEYGIPTGNPPVPVPLTAQEAEQYWANEFNSLTRHASQPIIHWPWHDYGPTTSSDPISGDGYNVEMFENTIALAYNAGSEFTTSIDVAQRINSFRNSSITVNSSGSVITANVSGNQLGKFSVAVNPPSGQVIKSVNNWYAYNTNRLFLDETGGTFSIQLGTSADSVTHITSLPMRSNLISVSGDGTNLDFMFEGEGKVKLVLNQNPNNFVITGPSSITALANNAVELMFDSFGTYNVSITLR